MMISLGVLGAAFVVFAAGVTAADASAVRCRQRDTETLGVHAVTITVERVCGDAGARGLAHLPGSRAVAAPRSPQLPGTCRISSPVPRNYTEVVESDAQDLRDYTEVAHLPGQDLRDYTEVVDSGVEKPEEHFRNIWCSRYVGRNVRVETTKEYKNFSD
jgi:hypothetical protein